MNRGARRAQLFPDESAYSLFLHLLGALPERYGVFVHAYALMPNHYHLLMEVPRGNLSRSMKDLNGQFSYKINRMYDWDGPVFRGRFRNRVVGDFRYWMHLLTYVHLNPVVGGLAANVDAAEWTSHRSYVDAQLAPIWLTTSSMLDLYGGVDAYQAYVQEHHEGRGTLPAGFDAKSLWTPSVSEVAVSATPDPPVHPISARVAMRETAELLGVTLEDLFTAPRGRSGNPSRWLAVWWLTVGAGLPKVQVARSMGIAPSGVSKMLERLQRRRQTDPVLANRMRQLLLRACREVEKG